MSLHAGSQAIPILIGFPKIFKNPIIRLLTPLLDDALNYTDIYDPQEAALIREVFGGHRPFMRYPGVEAAYAPIQSSCQFAISPGVPHRWPDWAFLKEFFERNRSEPFPPPLLYKIYFQHVASFGPYDTEVGLTNTSESAVSGSGDGIMLDGLHSLGQYVW